MVEDVVKTLVGHGLARRLHLGALDYRLREVVIRVLSGLHGGSCQFCCLGGDRIRRCMSPSLVGNLKEILLKLLPGLPPIAAGASCVLLMFENDVRCRFLCRHKYDRVEIV